MIKHKSKITLENKEISVKNLNYLTRFKKSLIAKKKASSTIYNYIKDIEQFLRYVGKDIEEVVLDDIKTYIEDCVKLGNGYVRVKRRFRALSSYYKFLYNRKLIEKDITLHIKIKDYEQFTLD